jgi:mRNA interferase RelE/StbE
VKSRARPAPDVIAASTRHSKVVFTLAAIDDLRRIGPSNVPRVLKKVLLLESEPRAVQPLGDELTGFRKLVVGRNTWRVVYRVSTDGSLEVCEVWGAGARSDGEVYAEVAARAAQGGTPELVRLAEVVGRLGQLAGIEVPSQPARDPVPSWLSERLVKTAGMAPEAVAAMDGPEALEAWTVFTSRPSLAATPAREATSGESSPTRDAPAGAPDRGGIDRR